MRLFQLHLRSSNDIQWQVMFVTNTYSLGRYLGHNSSWIKGNAVIVVSELDSQSFDVFLVHYDYRVITVGTGI